MTLKLVRGGSVVGRVVDQRGGAAAGAQIRCVASGLEDLSVQIGPLPMAAEAAALPSGTGRALAWTLKTAHWAGMIWPIRQSWPTSSSMPRRADLKLRVCRDAVSAGGRAA